MKVLVGAAEQRTTGLKKHYFGEDSVAEEEDVSVLQGKCNWDLVTIYIIAGWGVWTKYILYQKIQKSCLFIMTSKLTDVTL